MFLFALAWGIAAVVAFVLIEDRLAAVGFIALGLPVFLYGIQKSAKEERNLVCPTCHGLLPPPLESGPGSGEPVVYRCSKCDILWFAGFTRSD